MKPETHNPPPAPSPLGSGHMFDAIAGKYDLVNRVISLGMDQGWRRRAVRALQLEERAEATATQRAEAIAGVGVPSSVPASPTVPDLATGTADLAILITRMVPGAHVIGVDPSAGMLAVARQKVADAGLGACIDLREGDAQALDLPDRSVDAITMAFGIRNVPDRPKALREMARVTRPGGRIAIL
jgi:demethylmenaquinone methyltransferase/2-methoxy-6-polyprenyl-1,4-benzoquinol methylase